MKLTLTVIFALGLIPAAVAQHAPDPGTIPNGSIKGMGCVTAGVENGCTTLKDKKTGEVFTLFFDSDAPPPNTAISFEATARQGMTNCMQGTPVNVSKWTKVKMRCPKTKTAQAPAPQ
jgi:hypothetical protein